VLAAQEAGKVVDLEGAVNVWRGLIHGHWTIVDHCEREGRRFLLAVEGPRKPGQASSLTPREAQILARIALRQSLKLVSYELGVSHSTASALLQSALRKLRLGSVAEAVRVFSTGRAPQ
jgi:DNA-binding CsgD family transcriptional regulator